MDLIRASLGNMRLSGEVYLKTIIRNIFAVVVGLVLGGSVNMALIIFGPLLIPPPAGVDVTNTQSIAASIHLFEPRHYVFPFLAHALGTLMGAFAAFLIAGSHRNVFATVIGVFFLAGGVAASFMIPAPAWFITLDLVGAYLPMAWVGQWLGCYVVGRKLTDGSNPAA